MPEASGQIAVDREGVQHEDRDFLTRNFVDGVGLSDQLIQNRHGQGHRFLSNAFIG